MTVEELNKMIATIQGRLLGAGKQLEDADRKEIESELRNLTALIDEAVLPANSEAASKIEWLLDQTKHIKAPDFSKLVGGTTENASV